MIIHFFFSSYCLVALVLWNRHFFSFCFSFVAHCESFVVVYLFIEAVHTCTPYQPMSHVNEWLKTEKQSQHDIRKSSMFDFCVQFSMCFRNILWKSPYSNNNSSNFWWAIALHTRIVHTPSVVQFSVIFIENKWMQLRIGWTRLLFNVDIFYWIA